MSLNVNAYTSEGVRLRLVDVEHPGDELFGVEVCRRDLWGHPVMLRLGLSLLPSLKDSNIYAEGEVLLAQLENEARLALSQMSQVVANTKFREEYVAFRLQNLLGAIRRARELGGGVCIE